jgi:alkanesulfonate monooxygenase SsuD/methylene tetrahydromethanopterin reductase-like flavin-dependent oxidoreductase (luciferase family)
VELVRYRDLLVQLIARNIRTRYKRSVRGVLWTMLDPLLLMTVLTLEEARRRFGALVDIDRVATAGIPERCVEAVRRQIAQGISSVVCLFPDGGQPETIRLFGERVLPAFA